MGDLLHAGDRVLVGLSGGADSVMLLLWLHDEGYYVEAAHCNFGLRGTEADGDELFVSQLCERLDIPLHTTRFDTRAEAKKSGTGIEETARNLRYNYFHYLLGERHLDCIAIAHHRDDSIETMLLNLVRGTGLQGLMGIRPCGDGVVRPLLCLSREDIVQELEKRHQPYRTDSTNLEAIYSRNKIRLEVMPLLRSINPGADKNIATAIDNLKEVDKVYSEAMKRWRDYVVDEEKYNMELTDDKSAPAYTLYINILKLLACPSPLSVLQHLLMPLGFNRTQLVEILATREPGRVFYACNHQLVVGRTQLVLTRNAGNDEEDVELPLELYDNITTQRIKATDLTIDPSPRYAYIDAAKVRGRLWVRRVRVGDRFYPFGMKGSKLVSDLLTDQKVDLWERQQQMVVTDGIDILWVVGRRSSERHKVTAETVDVIVMKVED